MNIGCDLGGGAQVEREGKLWPFRMDNQMSDNWDSNAFKSH